MMEYDPGSNPSSRSNIMHSMEDPRFESQ